MNPIIKSWFVLVVAVGGWLNRQQDIDLQYPVTENQVLREQLKARGGRRRFTDDQRRRLAAKAKELGRQALRKLDTIVTPDTLLRWHRQLIARTLIVRMGTENRWGYLRIKDARRDLGHEVGRTTIANVLARHGVVWCGVVWCGACA